MTLDTVTLSLATAVVVIVAGITYLSETLMRKDGLSGRLWSVAFMAGILTVLSYLVWAADPRAYLAVTIGNAGFVASACFIWLGCLAFNGRGLRTPSMFAAILVLAAGLAAFLAGPDGGDWAGAVPLFAGTGLAALLAALESRRGAIGRRWSSVGLTIVLGLEALWFAGRTAVFVSLGPESDLFVTGFNTGVSSLIMIPLTIVAVVVTSVLRAAESNLRGQRDVYTLSLGIDGVLLASSFQSAAVTLLARAERAGESICLVSIRIDDVAQVATAFGPAEAEQVAASWRSGVRRYAPIASMVGDGASGSLLIAFVTTSFSDVRRMASIMHRRLLDDLDSLGVSVVPVVGVGIALTDQIGYEFGALVSAADAAAGRSVTSPDASVIIAEA